MELTRLQKILLAILAGMLVVFSGLMAFFRTHPGVLFEEALLKIEERDGQVLYIGRAHGDPVRIAVTWVSNFQTNVEFTIGERFHDVCEVVYPTEPIVSEDFGGVTVDGILVRKNGETIFEGGYDRENGYWFDQDGNWGPMFGIGFSGSDPWQGFEVTERLAARFAFGPETSAHGHPGLFSLAVFLTAVLALEIVFYETLFRWRHWGARDPEPSEGYLVLERAGWVVFTGAVAVAYIVALVEIY